MAKPTLLQCRICKRRDIDKSTQQEDIDYIRHGNCYWHKECYEERERRRKKIDIHDENSDSFWKDAAYNYLKREIKIEVTNIFFLQWEQYMKSTNPFYSAKGIYFALLYFYEIKKGNKDKSNGGIGIVPYIYEESRTYWYGREKKQQGIVADIERQMREAEHRQKKVVTKKSIQPRKFEVNLDAIEEMEDDEW